MGLRAPPNWLKGKGCLSGSCWLQMAPSAFHPPGQFPAPHPKEPGSGIWGQLMPSVLLLTLALLDKGTLPWPSPPDAGREAFGSQGPLPPNVSPQEIAPKGAGWHF